MMPVLDPGLVGSGFGQICLRNYQGPEFLNIRHELNFLLVFDREDRGGLDLCPAWAGASPRWIVAWAGASRRLFTF